MNSSQTYLTGEEDGSIIVFLMIVIQLVVLVLPLTEVLECGGRILIYLQPFLFVTQHHYLHHHEADMVLNAGMPIKPGGNGGQRQQVMMETFAILLGHGVVSHQEQFYLPGPGNGALVPAPRAHLLRENGGERCPGGEIRLQHLLPLEKSLCIQKRGPRGAASFTAGARRQRFEAEVVPEEEVEHLGGLVPVDLLPPGLFLLFSPEQGLHRVAGVSDRKVAIQPSAKVEERQGPGAPIHRAPVVAVALASGQLPGRPEERILFQIQEEAPSPHVEDVAHLAAPEVGPVDALHEAAGSVLAVPPLAEEGVRESRDRGRSGELQGFIIGRC